MTNFRLSAHAYFLQKTTRFGGFRGGGQLGIM